MLWNIPLPCVNICRYGWFNKEADGPIVEQNKNPTENGGKKEGGTQGRCQSAPKNQDM